MTLFTPRRYTTTPMARPLRIEFPGALYHVMSRGNERKPIVYDDLDRQTRIAWLRRTAETYGWIIHSFVLMTNHDHLFIATPEPNLSKGMQYLNAAYTSAFNRRHKRHGHLLQGRFKAQLVESEGHYLEISRYIHLNPCRARMVDVPEHHRWSSYPGYHWRRRRLPWVCYRQVLAAFGTTETRSIPAYRRFVRAGLERKIEVPWMDAAEGLIIGSEAFVASIRKRLGSTAEDPEVPELGRLRAKPKLEDIVTTALATLGYTVNERWNGGARSDDGNRAVIAYVARARFGHSAAATARILGYRTSSGVTRAISRVGSDEALRRRAEMVERAMRRR